MLKIHDFRYFEDLTKLNMVASILDRLKALSHEIEQKGAIIAGQGGKFYTNPALSAETEQKEAYFRLLNGLFE